MLPIPNFLNSSSPIQLHLKQLKAKGYLDGKEGLCRTLRVIAQPEKAQIELASLFSSTHLYALQVRGDSLIDDFIKEGDILIMRSLCGSLTTPKRTNCHRESTLVSAKSGMRK